MSGIKEKIQEDVKAAMKAREQHKVVTLRGVLAVVKQWEIDSRKTATDEDVTTMLQQEIRKRRDTLKFAEQQKRQDLIDQNNEELRVIQTYLGQPLSESELRQTIAAAIEAGADNVGKVMKELNSRHKGLFDGKLASTMAAELLKK